MIDHKSSALHHQILQGLVEGELPIIYQEVEGEALIMEEIGKTEKVGMMVKILKDIIKELGIMRVEFKVIV